MLDEPWIDDEDDTVDGNRGLSDICRKDDLPRTLRCWLEDLRLHVTGKIGIDRTDDELFDLVTQCSSRLLQVLLRSFDLILTL